MLQIQSNRSSGEATRLVLKLKITFFFSNFRLPNTSSQEHSVAAPSPSSASFQSCNFQLSRTTLTKGFIPGLQVQSALRIKCALHCRYLLNTARKCELIEHS